nr:hypothetical protein L203_04062 [Cryptococcus depauperatus CBS 7841]
MSKEVMSVSMNPACISPRATYANCKANEIHSHIQSAYQFAEQRHPYSSLCPSMTYPRSSSGPYHATPRPVRTDRTSRIKCDHQRHAIDTTLLPFPRHLTQPLCLSLGQSLTIRHISHKQSLRQIPNPALAFSLYKSVTYAHRLPPSNKALPASLSISLPSNTRNHLYPIIRKLHRKDKQTLLPRSARALPECIGILSGSLLTASHREETIYPTDLRWLSLPVHSNWTYNFGATRHDSEATVK